MKIYWCHSHFLNWTGGSKYIFEVVKRLSKKYEVIVVASVFSSEAAKIFTSVGVKIIPLNNMSTNSSEYWMRLLRNINYESANLKKIVGRKDIIISSMFPMNCIAEKLNNIHIQCCWEPYALFYDKNFLKSFSWTWRIRIVLTSFLYRPLDLIASRKADKIITLSKYYKRWIKNIYGRNDALISYEGVDTNFFRRTKNTKVESIYKGDKIIFHSTDFTTIKGTKYLVEAFPKVLAVYPRTKLLISNTIENLNEKKKIYSIAKKLGFSERIVFLGRVNLNMLRAYYSLADVVVQPSIKQNMSLSIKEAMSCQTPVVTSKEGYEQTPNGKAGLLVDSENSDDIAEAIIKIISDKKLSFKMGEEGRRIVLEKFSWDSVAGVFEKAIKSVAKA